MSVRTNIWVVGAAFLVVCFSSVAGLYLWRVKEASTTAALLARLPAGSSTMLYADIEALRDTGLLELLAGTGMEEVPDYREFVERTGFDYRTDLDSVLASFHQTDSYFLARGRFRWGQLNSYVEEQGGTCHNGRCRVEGSVRERRISFSAITYNVLALASSPDSWAILTLEEVGDEPPQEEIPDEPFWVSMPAASLMTAAWMPVGTQSFARALSAKDRVVFSIGQAAGGFEAKVRVECSSAQDAAGLATELRRVTDLLREMIRLENKTPNPNDLSGVLSSGVFEHTGYAVIGRWPVSREFLEAVASGGTGEQQEAAAEEAATTP